MFLSHENILFQRMIALFFNLKKKRKVFQFSRCVCIVKGGYLRTVAKIDHKFETMQSQNKQTLQPNDAIKKHNFETMATKTSESILLKAETVFF